MSDLVQYDSGLAYTQEQIEIIKSQIAKGATDDELKMFINIAQRYGLDPFTKDIWFIKRAKKSKDYKTGEWDYKRNKDGSIDYTDAETLIMTSRDGYLKVAQRDFNFAGIISFVVREGDTFEIDADNYKVIHKFGAKRGHIIGAWSRVEHKQRKPVITFVDFSEYNDAKSTTWKQYPSAMIQKVAEVFALKRQFGISGLVTREEMASQVKEEEFESVLDVKPEELREEIHEVYICQECGNEIIGNEKGDAKNIVEASRIRFGKELCASCARKALKAEREGAVHDVPQTEIKETPSEEQPQTTV